MNATMRRFFEGQIAAHALELCREKDDEPREDDSASRAPTARELQLYAQFAADQGQHEFALACLDRASQVPDVDAAVLADLARTLRSRGRERYAEALVACDRAIALQPDDVEATGERCATLVALGRVNEAVACAAEAAARLPESDGMACVHGDMLLARARIRLAEVTAEGAGGSRGTGGSSGSGASTQSSGNAEANDSSEASDTSDATKTRETSEMSETSETSETNGRVDVADAVAALRIFDAVAARTPHDAAIHRRIGQARLVLGRACVVGQIAAPDAVAHPTDLSTSPATASRIEQAHADASAAADAFRAARQLKDDSPETFCGLADALVMMNEDEEAVATLRTAAGLHRRSVMISRALVDLLERLGRRDDAVTAWCRLGADLAAEDRFDEARAAYREAIARRPGCLNARVRLGLSALELAEPRDAFTHFDIVVRTHPRHAIARVGLGWAAHQLGDHRRGWAELDRSRVLKEQTEHDALPWTGATSIAGRTVLLWADQALGDTLQFVRYAQLVKARGARVLVECDFALLPLIERMPCVDLAIGRGAPPPPFDEHVALSALPGIFDPAIPAYDPPLSIPDEAIETWRDLLGDSGEALRVGLVWAGEPSRINGRQKFAPLASLAPLASVPGVRFISLQLGPQLAELIAAPSGLRIETVLTRPDIIETAAAILNCDLVVTVDTLVSHLSGALGQRTWTVLPYAADWRWGLMGTTPWYASMRLLRQRHPRDWQELFTRLADDLRSLVAHHHQARSTSGSTARSSIRFVHR